MMSTRKIASPVPVRQATVSDASEIALLYLKFLRTYGHGSEHEIIVRFLKNLLKQSWVIFFVATDESNRIIGFAGCTMSYSAVSQLGAITINDLFVADKDRRRGVATALCSAIEDHAKRMGLAKIFVETAPDAEAAIATYKKAGFEVKKYNKMTKELQDV